jgi:hypothetical protein
MWLLLLQLRRRLHDGGALLLLLSVWPRTRKRAVLARVRVHCCLTVHAAICRARISVCLGCSSTSLADANARVQKH